MSRKEWIAVVVVIGLGIVWQIPRHDGAMSTNGEPRAGSSAEAQAAEGAEPSARTAPAEVAGPYRTIALEVTGMT